MPNITGSGIVFPIRGDEPQWQALADLGQSIDDPQDLDFDGKIRVLEADSSQSFDSSTTLERFDSWTPASSPRDGDQGDGCGIQLNASPVGHTLTVTEAGFYLMIVNFGWASSNNGIRRVALHDPDTGNYYQTRSQSVGEFSSFHNSDVANIVWLDIGQRIDVEVAQSSGGTIDGGNTGAASGRTTWITAKVRLM